MSSDTQPKTDAAATAELPSVPVSRFALTVGVVMVLVTLASYLVPSDYAATAVAVVFLAATHALVLRLDGPAIRAYGLSLAGALEPDKIDPKRLARAALRAFIVSFVCYVAIVVPFWLGYRSYNHLSRPFSWASARPGMEEVLGQIFVIALPEEAFFRGYVQTRLDAIFPRRINLLSLPIGPSILITSALFAVCHFATIPNPARLAVFFPSLLFGALRAREGGIGACVLLHAACNLLSAALQRGYAAPHHP